MATAEQQQAVPHEQHKAAETEFKSLIDRKVSFTPDGEQDAITLSPRQVVRFLCVRTASGKAATAEDCVRFIMLCKSHGLNPWKGDAWLTGYDTNQGPKFSMIISVHAMLRRAEQHQEYDGLESGIVVLRTDGTIEQRDGEIVLDTEQLIGAWAKVYRKDRKIPFFKTVNRRAYDKGRSVWKDNAAGMLLKVAKKQALTDAFPASLGGMTVEGEVDTDVFNAPVEDMSPPSLPKPEALQEAPQEPTAAEEEPPNMDRELELQSLFDAKEAVLECQELRKQLLDDTESDVERELINAVFQARCDTIRANRGK